MISQSSQLFQDTTRKVGRFASCGNPSYAETTIVFCGEVPMQRVGPALPHASKGYFAARNRPEEPAAWWYRVGAIEGFLEVGF